MDVLRIAQGDNDSDTSQEDFEDEEEPETAGTVPENENDSIAHVTGHHLECGFDKWKRPVIPLGKNEDINFMIMDSDFGILPTRKVHENIQVLLNPKLQDSSLEQSYIRLHGVTRDGRSVCCNVFNFLPYFYVMPIPGSAFLETDIPAFKNNLSSSVKREMLREMKWVRFHKMLQSSDPIISVELVNEPNHGSKLKVFGLKPLSPPSASAPAEFKLLKITCRVPKFVLSASNLLKNGKICFPRTETGTPFKYNVYEASINHTIRFFTDMNIPGCSWVQVSEGTYFLRNLKQKLSHAQLEFDVLYTEIKSNQSEDFIPPLRILSCDIEVVTRPPLFRFPVNGREEIIQIGNVMSTYTSGQSNGSDTKVAFTLKSCDEIPGTEIFSFENEKELLMNWRAFLLAFDPDIVTGYNIKKFDFPYLIDRAKMVHRFLGRTKDVQSRIRPVKTSSKRFFKYDDKTLNLNGRIIFDMMLLIMRHDTVKTNSPLWGGKFTLNNVAKRYLNETKEDVCHTKMFEMQNKGPAARKVMASYCVQDAWLPYSLLKSHFPDRKNSDLNVLDYYIQRSRETGVPLKYLVTKSIGYQNNFKRIRAAKKRTSTIRKRGRKCSTYSSSYSSSSALQGNLDTDRDTNNPVPNSQKYSPTNCAKSSATDSSHFAICGNLDTDCEISDPVSNPPPKRFKFVLKGVPHSKDKELNFQKD